MTENTAALQRDHFTWVAYLAVGFFVVLQSMVGPAMPFLRAELGLNFAQGGLHLTTAAAGGLIVSALLPVLVRLLGRRGVFLVGGIGAGAGARLLGVGQVLPLTLTGTLLIGLCGTGMLVTSQAALNDRFGESAPQAIAEANATGSFGGMLAPLIIGGVTAAGRSWRLGPLAVAALMIVIMATSIGMNVPAGSAEPASVTGRLPPGIASIVGMLYLGVAVEWCLITWSTDFLVTAAGLDPSLASSLLGTFFVANVITRLAAARLTRSVAVRVLLLVMVVLSLTGFLIFWLLPVAVPDLLPGVVTAVVGLFVAGLGIANFYPLLFALGLRSVPPNQTDRVSGRLSLAAALGVVTMPQLMGIAADQIGLALSFTIVPVLLVAMLGVGVATLRAGQTDSTRVS
ncbi:MAG: sugar MFS transporter [Anaerolineae bacterium]